MKRITLRFLLTAFLSVMVAGAALAPRVAMADAPTMTILSPTGTIFVSGSGSIVPIMMTVGHDQLKNLTQFDVKVDDVSLIGGQLNPFTSGATPNQCTTDLIAVSAACSTNGSDLANVTVNWTVLEVPATYALFIKSRHTSVDGIDEEEVIVQLLDIQYPAPPAVANGYIKTTYGKALGAKVRGCIISQIANKHAMLSSYGPKGGPYVVTDINNDVELFYGQCNP
jgi:hypothetical protein